MQARDERRRSVGASKTERRPITPAALAPMVVSQAILLVAIWAGDLPYVAAQLLLAAELLLINLATIPLYWSRGLARHIGDTLKFSAVLLFLLFFVAVTYGSASGFHGSQGLDAARLALGQAGVAAIAWGVVYVVGNVLIQWFQAFTSPNPRLSWTRGSLIQSGINLVTLFLSILVVLFVGMPVIDILRRVFDSVSIDGVLGTLVVITRFAVAIFVFRVFTDRDLDEMSGNPYAE